MAAVLSVPQLSLMSSCRVHILTAPLISSAAMQSGVVYYVYDYHTNGYAHDWNLLVSISWLCLASQSAMKIMVQV